MNKIFLRFKTLGLATLLSLGTPVLADDTEIYLGASNTPSTVLPNVVFIIDTSGSMSSTVTKTTTAGVYASATTYAGTCVASKVYYSTTGTPPSCITSDYIAAANFHCGDAATGLGGDAGYYTTRAAQYRGASSRGRSGGSTWQALSNRYQSDDVECQGDWGTHGNATAADPTALPYLRMPLTAAPGVATPPTPSTGTASAAPILFSAPITSIGVKPPPPR